MSLEPRIRVSALLRWQDRVLLCRHEKAGRGEYWLLPGGGVNSGESLVDALHRELREEVGIEDEIPVEGPVALVDSIAPQRAFAAKHGITIVNTPGLVDSGYRGELKVILLNTDGNDAFVVEPGMRIAQLVVMLVPGVAPVEVEELPESERGVRGFGSSAA